MSCTGGTRRWPLSNPTHCHHTQPFCSFWQVCNTAASSYRKLLENKQQSLPFCTHSDIIRAKLGESRHVLASPSTSKHLPVHPSISQHMAASPQPVPVSPQSTFAAFHMPKGMHQAGPRVMETPHPRAGAKSQETCRSPNLCPKMPPNRGTDSQALSSGVTFPPLIPTSPATNQGLNQAGNYAVGSKRNCKALLSLRGGF